MDEKIDNVIKWADERGLIAYKNRFKQLAKTIEELGELSSAMLKKDDVKIIDGIGDTYVTLIILAEDLGYSIDMCLQVAYDEIKGRTGRTIDGTFIKDK